MSLKTLRIWNHPNRNIIKLAILFQAPCIKYDLNRLINNKKLWLYKSRYSTQGIKLPLKYFNRICLYLPWALCVLIWPKRLLIIIVFGLTQIGPLITKLRSYELKDDTTLVVSQENDQLIFTQHALFQIWPKWAINNKVKTNYKLRGWNYRSINIIKLIFTDSKHSISLFYIGYLRNKTRPTAFWRKLYQSISICIPRTKLEPHLN